MNINAGTVRGARLVAVLAFVAMLAALPAWAGSSHVPDWHTGLSSPMRETSATIAYTASGGRLMVIEPEWW